MSRCELYFTIIIEKKSYKILLSVFFFLFFETDKTFLYAADEVNGKRYLLYFPNLGWSSLVSQSSARTEWCDYPIFHLNSPRKWTAV